MPQITELLELARQCYAQASTTLNPEAKKALQDIGARYLEKADKLRRVDHDDPDHVEALFRKSRRSTEAAADTASTTAIGGPWLRSEP